MVVHKTRNKHYYSYLMLFKVIILFLIFEVGAKILSILELSEENEQAGVNVLLYLVVFCFVCFLIEWRNKYAKNKHEDV